MGRRACSFVSLGHQDEVGGGSALAVGLSGWKRRRKALIEFVSGLRMAVPCPLNRSGGLGRSKVRAPRHPAAAPAQVREGETRYSVDWTEAR